MSKTSQGIGFVLLAALLWSLGGLGIKLVDAPGPAIGGLRCLMALPILVLAIGPRRILAAGPSALRSPWVWAAALSYAVCVVTFAMSTRLTTAAMAILLQYTGPIHTALLSGPLLKEPPRRWDYVAIVAMLLGMALFGLDGLDLNARLGAALALVSGLGFGALPVFMRRELLREGSVPESAQIAVLLGNVIGFVATAPYCALHYPTDANSWLVLAGLGTAQIGFAYLAYGAGLRRLRAMDAALIATLEPILNPLWVAIGTHEVPGPFTVVGGAVIVVAVVAQQALPRVWREAEA